MKRLMFLRWIRDHVANVPEGTVNPKWLTFIYSLLFPLNALYEKQSRIKYDFRTDVYTIEGVNISGSFFKSISSYAKTGVKYELVENKEGIVTIKFIE